MTKRFLGVLLVICLAGVAAFADDDVAVSKTFDATSGMFSEDQDNYLDIIDWKEITKTMLFLSLGSPTESSNDFQFGFAKTFGGIYVGSKVTINQIGSNGNPSSSETSSITLNTNQQGVIGRTVTKNSYVDKDASYDNSADFLIGIGNMGIFVGVTHDSYDNTGTFSVSLPTFPTNADTWYSMTSVVGGVATSSVTKAEDLAGTVTYEDSTVYSEGSKNDNHLGINLGFGMSMPVAGLDANFGGYLNIDLYNDSDNASVTDYVRNPLTALYVTYKGIDNAVSYSKSTADYSNERMVINPMLGFEVEMPVSFMGGSTLTAGLGYALDMPIYTGDSGTSYSYSYESYTTNFNGQNLQTSVTTRSGEETTEISEMTNSVMPYVEVEKDFSERLKLAIGYYPQVSFYNYSTTFTGTTTESVVTDNVGTDTDSVVVTTAKRNSTTTDTSRLRFSNTIAVGTQFKLTEKLRVNVGASATGGYLQTTTNKGSVDGVTEYHEYTYEEVTAVAADTVGVLTDYDIDTTSTEPYQTEYNYDLDMSTSYNAGLTYFYDENLKIDMLVDVAGATTTNIFDFATWTVEFTYSY